MKCLAFAFLLIISACGDLSSKNKSVSETQLNQPVQIVGDHFHFPKTERPFIVEWVEGPRVGESRFLLKTWKHGIGTINGPYQDFDSTFNVVLWMPEMGHGSAPVKITKLDQGEYEVSEVQFLMSGHWEIKLQLKDQNQVVDEFILYLTL